MLEPLLGSRTRERVLIFIFARESGYGTEIASFTLYTPSRNNSKSSSRVSIASQPVGRTRLQLQLATASLEPRPAGEDASFIRQMSAPDREPAVPAAAGKPL
jgi:hypothetical protein